MKDRKRKTLEGRICISINPVDKERLETVADFNRLKPSSFARQCMLLTLDELEKAMEINKSREREFDVKI